MAFGALTFGALGGAADAFSASQTRKQQARFRRRQRAAIQQARDFTGGTTVQLGNAGLPGGFTPGQTISNEDLEAGLPGNLATFLDPRTGERRVGGRVDEILADPLLSNARSFLEGTFENAADSPLARDFAKGIASAQSARGTFFGGAGVSAEAGGLSAFAQRLRQDLLPSALQFGQLGEQLRQSVLGFEAPLRVAAATGGSGFGDSSQLLGPSVFGSGLSGLLSGAAGGFSLDKQFGITNSLLGREAEPRVAVDSAGGGPEEAIAFLLRNLGGF